jgi:hypothetical protein
MEIELTGNTNIQKSFSGLEIPVNVKLNGTKVVYSSGRLRFPVSFGTEIEARMFFDGITKNGAQNYINILKARGKI